MREIKFRAWWPEAKRMYLPNPGCDLLVRIDGKLFVQIDIEENSGLDPAVDMVLMQFTGLHDKNGKEIWEGDIVKNLSGAYGAYDDVVAKIEYSECKGGFIDKYWGDTLDHYGFMEVLGNCFEHPHLLESK